jgi:hypothetical protein
LLAQGKMTAEQAAKKTAPIEAIKAAYLKK